MGGRPRPAVLDSPPRTPSPAASQRKQLIGAKNSTVFFPPSSNGGARVGDDTHLEPDTGGVALAGGGYLLGWPQTPYRRGEAPDGGGRVPAGLLSAGIALTGPPPVLRGRGPGAAAGSGTGGWGGGGVLC
jgi:hypothetical protein